MALICRLSTSLPRIARIRLISSTSPISSAASTQKYPYPTKSSKPTPHQIFHLQVGASQEEIKARYYELVRHHHPDSTHCRELEPAERHARFQSITAAYDILRGKKPHMAGAAGFSSEGGGGGDSYMAEVLRRKQFAEAHRRRANYARPERPFYEASADDRMKDRVIIIIGGVALFLGVAPGLFMLPSSLENSHRSAVANLRQARLEAQELGEERMIEVRKRARDIRRKQGSNDDDLAASD